MVIDPRNNIDNADASFKYDVLVHVTGQFC